MENVLDTLDPVQIGQYLTHFRELHDLLYIQVASELSCEVEHVERLERGEIRPKASEIVKLASIFDCQIYELLNGPYPDATDEELMAQLVRGEISESQAAYRMKVDRLEVRRRLEEDVQS